MSCHICVAIGRYSAAMGSHNLEDFRKFGQHHEDAHTKPLIKHLLKKKKMKKMKLLLVSPNLLCGFI